MGRNIMKVERVHLSDRGCFPKDTGPRSEQCEKTSRVQKDRPRRTWNPIKVLDGQIPSPVAARTSSRAFGNRSRRHLALALFASNRIATWAFRIFHLQLEKINDCWDTDQSTVKYSKTEGRVARGRPLEGTLMCSLPSIASLTLLASARNPNAINKLASVRPVRRR